MKSCTYSYCLKCTTSVNDCTECTNNKYLTLAELCVVDCSPTG